MCIYVHFYYLNHFVLMYIYCHSYTVYFSELVLVFTICWTSSKSVKRFENYCCQLQKCQVLQYFCNLLQKLICIMEVWICLLVKQKYQGCRFSVIFCFFLLFLAQSETHLYVNILYFLLFHLSVSEFSVSFCVHFL